MKRLFQSIDICMPYLYSLAFAKALSLAMLLFLPFSVEKKPFLYINSEMKNYKVEEAFGFKTRAKQTLENQSFSSIASSSLKELTLQAIYKNDSSGYAVLHDSSTKETIILSLNENYKEYTLKGLFPNYIILSKQHTEYRLTLFDETFTSSEKVSKKTDLQDGVIEISKEELLHFSNDLNSIWKNITLRESKQNGSIVGFEVAYIKKPSPFGKLGLLKGDIIIKLNSEPLTSYSQALKVYNEIQTYDYLELTVMRNGKEKELYYEIK